MRDSSVLLMGLAYKQNTGDARQTPALVVAKRLAELGARVQAVDPLVARITCPTGSNWSTAPPSRSPPPTS